MAVVGGLGLVVASSVEAKAISSPAPDSVIVVPDPDVRAHAMSRPVRGRGYRPLWLEPLRVPVADLSRVGGGLTPIGEREATNTRILLLTGPTGAYQLQTVARDPTISLPEWIVKTPGSGFARDLMAAQHPSGALVAAGLSEALGFPPLKPRLVFLGDNPQLGSYRQAFGRQLAILELHPGPDLEPGCDAVVTTAALRDSLRAFPWHRIDGARYLRARLLDCLIGDGYRSGRNWVWLRHPDSTGVTWRPYPLNREMAFVHAEGLSRLPWRAFMPGFFRFGPTYPSVHQLTWTALDLDRPFLVSLEKPIWDSVTAEIQAALPDTVIRASIARMPAAHQSLTGGWMARSLDSRRDLLPEFADRFYRLIREYAIVELTDASEQVVIERLPGGSVTLRVFPLSDNAVTISRTSFESTFLTMETKEIRVYCGEGDDRIHLMGAGPARIRIRISGGGGEDSIQDDSVARGRGIHLYDPEGFKSADGRRVPRSSTMDARPPRLWWDEFGGRGTPDWGTATRPTAGIDINGDNGVLLQVGIQHDRREFLRDPYRSRLEGSVTYATRQGRPAVELAHDYQDLLASRLRSRLQLRFSGIDVIRYYGFGNETPSDQPEDFYEMLSQSLTLRHRLSYQRSTGLDIGLGVEFTTSDTDTTPAQQDLISSDRPYGAGRFRYAGVTAEAHWTLEDAPPTARWDVDLTVGGGFFPPLLDVKGKGFGESSIRAASSVALTASGSQVLAAGGIGRWGFGRVPVTRTPSLGGSRDLRGFPSGRFRGDGSIYLFVEHQVRIARGYRIFFPTDLGLVVFADGGRVFLSGEQSRTVHAAFGGGLWLAPAIPGFKELRDLRLQGEVAVSEEQTSIYLRTGYRF